MRLTIEIELDIDGPVTESIVVRNVKDAVERERLKTGLTDDGDPGTVRSVRVVDHAKPCRRVRIKCTENRLKGNVAYVHQNHRGEWRCQLANGIPASFSYAGVHRDEVGVILQLDRADTPEEALAIMDKAGGGHWTYEIV